MAHLNFFGIDNFKVFKDLNRFELKPITVLVGTNSSGKSSLSKGILALKSSFEKIKYQYHHNGKKEKEFIQMGEIEKLFFQSDLNLGNFSTCLNNKSNRPDMTFEFPIKFNILKDSLLIKFVYKNSTNALQNGELKDIVIIHLDTNIEVFHYDEESKSLKINFSFFKEKLDIEQQKIVEVLSISKQIIELEKRYRGAEWANEIPKEIQLQIEGFEKQQQVIYPNYKLHLTWSNIQERFPYLSNLSVRHEGVDNHFVENYGSNLPLINFPFLFSEEYLRSISQYFEMNEEEFDTMIDVNHQLQSEFSKMHDTTVAYINESILKCLDEHILGDKSYPEYSSLSSILKNHLINSLVTNKMISISYGFKGDIIKKLIQKEPLLERVNNPEIILNRIIINSDEKQLFTDTLTYLFNDFIYDSIGDALNTLGRSYKSTYFIPAVRTKMERFFRIGSGDSYLQEVLYLLHQSKLNKEAQKFIDSYLQKFGIADGIELNLSEDSSGTKIYLIKEGKRLELADVGYGVAQVLPIILQLGYLISINTPIPPFDDEELGWHDSTIIIEEPETNLHPALQSKLADMFVECYKKYSIQFIIETHSEYLIRKLQYLTAKKEFAAKDSVIYYFNDPNNIPVGEKQVKKIEILEDGSLSDDFGSGFFDEATNWKFELMELRKAQKN